MKFVVIAPNKLKVVLIAGTNPNTEYIPDMRDRFGSIIENPRIKRKRRSVETRYFGILKIDINVLCIEFINFITTIIE